MIQLERGTQLTKALNSSLDISPRSSAHLKAIIRAEQSQRHITAQTVLTQEAIPEEGGQQKNGFLFH